MKTLLAAVPLVIASSLTHAADCGTVTIAEMNWASAEFAANLDKIILEEGYGCNVELIRINRNLLCLYGV